MIVFEIDDDEEEAELNALDVLEVVEVVEADSERGNAFCTADVKFLSEVGDEDDDRDTLGGMPGLEDSLKPVCGDSLCC